MRVGGLQVRESGVSGVRSRHTPLRARAEVMPGSDSAHSASPLDRHGTDAEREAAYLAVRALSETLALCRGRVALRLRRKGET